MNRILSRALGVWMLVLLATGPAGAAPTEDAAGLENLRKSAEGGDAAAMLELGILYEFGYRMPDHKPPALAWYRLAAETGDAKATARQDALRATMSPSEIEQANKLYNEYAAAVRKPAPSPPPPATAPAPAPAEPTPPSDNK